MTARAPPVIIIIFMLMLAPGCYTRNPIMIIINNNSYDSYDKSPAGLLRAATPYFIFFKSSTVELSDKDPDLQKRRGQNNAGERAMDGLGEGSEFTRPYLTPFIV
jgi:hypothetical protein